MVTVRDVQQALEAWAPPAVAQSYDQVGLQVGSAARPVETVLVALDLTADVVDEAVDLGASLIITHHPLLFKPLARITDDHPLGALVLRMAQAGISYYAAHTNLDAAPGGVSVALARQIGLSEVTLLTPEEGRLRKLVVFVPTAAASTVREAMGAAGAGHLGDYADCAFETRGTGSFRPLEEASPHIGSAGGSLERVEEVKVEVLLHDWEVPRVVRAMRAAHPYEEVAYDVYTLEQATTQYGLGAVGTLREPLPLSGLLQRIAERLDTPALHYVGDPAATVQRVAVCGGSGSSLIGQARRAGADAYLTADVTYHTYFQALDPEGAPHMALINAGHYETEAITESLLVEWLEERFPSVAWHRTAHRTSPVSTFLRSE